MNRIMLLGLMILLLGPNWGWSQVVDGQNKITVTLRDGTVVTCYGKAQALSDEPSTEFEYMPTNFRLAVKEDGTPQFLFLKYTDESANEEASGAILHMLMEFGLTPEQEREVERKLRSEVEGATLRGMVDVTPEEEQSIRIISATLDDGESVPTLIHSGRAPVFPGNKIAVAARMDKEAAQLLDASFTRTRSITDLSVTLSYKYAMRVPAARGLLVEDWSKLDSLNLVDSAFYSMDEIKNKDYGEKAVNAAVGAIFGGGIGGLIGWFATGNDKEKHFTYEDMHNLYRALEEEEVITLRFEENVSDERVTEIREAFFQHFLNSFTDAVPEEIEPITDEQRMAMPDIKKGNSYKFKREFVETVYQKRRRVFNLNYALAIERPFQITENLASWYDQVSDNPACVGTVVLNDPFFQHRDVHVLLDLDAEDMIGKEMNYVTVSLRKQRDVQGANDFSHQLTFDRAYFEESGNRRTVTYSKAQDGDPNEYEYKVQWSLRGGHLFPENDTTWTKGSWQGITLAPPVQPKRVRFEADLDELKELDIRNVTLQLRYMKFGKEVETNMNISLYSKQPYLEETIYLDKDTRGYAYRLIFTHKRKGILAMPWDASINTYYLFAVVPDELYEGDETFIEEAIARGQQAMVGGDVDGSQAILNQFESIISNQ
ncbi:hypothetical protein [Pontibacter sp. G13]|uniref:hypothetical protein n=1 Tax=Pontibacter sp. G13 TaxID=3074898 RepID=UPI0028892E9C|nr:hypothetical protein [Pontibacter sp. G13]WNJ19646.1 hypothetical protein RJD25_04100 [Pontibacter sp. G13]